MTLNLRQIELIHGHINFHQRDESPELRDLIAGMGAEVAASLQLTLLCRAIFRISVGCVWLPPDGKMKSE